MEEINFKQSGGFINVRMRVLQTYTLRTHDNGRIIVRDDRSDRDVGFGFATPADAVKHYERQDLYRNLHI